MRYSFYVCRTAAILILVIFRMTGSCQTMGPGKNFLLGKYDYSKDTSFIKVPSSHVQTGKTVYLKKEAYNAFLKMSQAALKSGMSLKIISGTRSFDDQKYKWDSKWDLPEFAQIKNLAEHCRKLLRWWSMPGTSRHHWGTDIDLNNMQLAYFKTKEGIKLYNWLAANAAKYGFYQPFNANRSAGYQEEKWHWSYVPLSRKYLREYVKRIHFTDIIGFAGSNAVRELDVIKNWVLAVNPECK